MKNSLAVALVAALSLAATQAQAEVRFSGFGQVIAGSTSGEDDRFPMRGYTNEVDFQEESLFALQIDADLNERVTATAQLLADGSEDFEPELAWAYANVKLGKGFSTKIGRQRIPFYRYSDFLDVGYAYPWVRPPVAMYNQPWSNADGISLSHNTYLGKWFSQAQVIVGRFEGDIDINGAQVQSELDQLRGVSWDMEYDEWLSLRAAYLTADVTISGSSLDGFTGFLRSVGLGNLASGLDYQDDRGTFKSLGFKVDRANWLVVSEYAELEIDDSVYDSIDRRDWYVSVARRFGAFTPYVNHGRRDAGQNTALLRGLPPGSPLHAGVSAAIASQSLDEQFDSVGVRWDFDSNVALKADYTRFNSELASTPDADLVSVGLVYTF
ncbi:MAG: porin [Pseudomonadota bacterium]|nr:porin [Pseudomonadota bacterium]